MVLIDVVRKEGPFSPPPKKVFNPLTHTEVRLLSRNDIALNDVSPESIVHTAVLMEEIDFVRESQLKPAL